MGEVLRSFGLPESENQKIREIQAELPRNLVERAEASAYAAGCYMVRMRGQYPEVFNQWLQDMRNGGRSDDTFIDRLPPEHAREGNRLVSELNQDRNALMRHADAAAQRLGYGNERAPSNGPRSNSYAELAVLDITERPQHCVMSEAPAQTNGTQTRIAQTRPRGPGMGA